MLTTALIAAALPVYPAVAPVIAADSPAAAPPPEAAPAITVVSAERREIVERLSVTGTVVSREEAVVGIDLAGLIVASLDADAGDIVTQGQRLAVLDRSTLDTQLAQANASWAQADAGIAQAKAQIADAEIGVRQAQEGLDRAIALRDRGVAAQSQLDNAVNAADSARAKLSASQKAVASAEAQRAVIEAQRASIELQISKTDVKAPVGGLILERNATLGGIVSMSGGPLFRIAKDAEFELAATVPETDLPRLKAGQKAEVHLAGFATPLQGAIRLVAPEVNQTTRLGTIYVSLPADAGARPGNFSRATVETLRKQAVAVPVGALVYRGSQALLQQVKDNRIHTVEVVTGARDGAWVEIVSGITEGDDIVSRAGTFVDDGDLIAPVRSEQTGALKP